MTPLASASKPIGARIALFTFIRLVINSTYRMVYAMQPLLAAGMGVTLTDLSLALSVRSLLGTFAPFLAIFSDTHGRKKGMMLGLSLFILGVGLIAGFQTFSAFVIGASIVVVGNSIFIPSMQSYVSDYVPFEKRGRVLSFTEMSWSLGFIIGAPFLGYLLTRYNWVAPHIALTVIGLVLLAIFWWVVPADKVQRAKQPLLQNLGLVLKSTAVLAGVAASISATGANELINIIFGEWIKDSFGLAFATLTVASIVIGASEMGSELLGVLMLDRVDKHKAMIAALGVNALASLLMPLTGRSLPFAIGTLAVIFITYEVSLLGLITLMSETVPSARATVMALTVATFSGGRIFGSLFSARLYLLNFWAPCLLAVALDIVATFLVRHIKIKDPTSLPGRVS